MEILSSFYFFQISFSLASVYLFGFSVLKVSYFLLSFRPKQSHHLPPLNMTLLLSFYPSLYPFPPVPSKLSPLLCPYASYWSQTEYISVSQSHHACTHLLVLHMMFPLPNTLKTHMHTSFSRLVHLSCASSPRKPSSLRPLSPPTTWLVPAMSWQSTLDHSLYCNYHTHREVLVTE